jgi:hypothetical protein
MLSLLLSLALIAIPIVPYAPAPGGTAMVDTGGQSETALRHPLDFGSLYRGLGVGYVLGIDYLKIHTVDAGTTSGKPQSVVALDVRTSKEWTLAFVTCTIGGKDYRMLLDTAALVWPSNSPSEPKGAIYLATGAFEALHRSHPQWPYRAGGSWIVDARDHFVEARSMQASTSCGGVKRDNRLLVERTDDSTYRYMRQLFDIRVDGDASLAAFEANGVRIDFPARELRVFM